MPTFGPPEPVYVELEWYDGPRVGIANLNGQPHRFISQWDDDKNDYRGTFLVWPVGEAELALEQEQWGIYVEWNERYETGEVTSASHPGNPGTNRRWDDIEALLSSVRKAAPATAKVARMRVVYMERDVRYARSGPDYQIEWALI